MILSPLENGALHKALGWIQVRPVITQEFGENKKLYSRFGMIGHNGQDYRAKIGTPVYAAFDGVVMVRDHKDAGYGKHIRLRTAARARECMYGHLSRFAVLDGEQVNMGQLIGYTGNTGFSTGPHLHFGLRMLRPSKKPIWKWLVRDYDNGYWGWIPCVDAIITFKGGPVRTSIR